MFDVGVFTAAVDYYADQILEKLDPCRKIVKVLLTRQHCKEISPNIYVKDLRIIAERDVSQIFLVDNCAYSYFFQPDNGIPITHYHQGREDQELVSLEKYLLLLARQEDPLAFNRQYFKTGSLMASSNFNEALAEMFG